MANDPSPTDLFPDGSESVFSRLVAGELTEAERAAVDRRLREDDAFRQAYLRWSILETDLETVLGDDPPTPPRPARWTIGRIVLGRRATTVAWALALTAVVAVVVAQRLGNRAEDRKRVIAQSERAADLRAPGDGDAVGSTLAVIADAIDAPPHFAVGKRLASERLALDDGRLLVSFLGGAKLLLQGPAELRLRGPNHAELTRGRVAVRDSASPRAFRLDLPDATVVDRGTEFAVRTEPEGHSFVRVQEGEVSVSVLGEDGTNWVSDVVGENQTVVLTPREEVPLQEAESSDMETVSPVPPVPQLPLAISSAYVAAVKAQRPVLYWRFESLDEDGMVPDEGALGCRGRLVNRGADDDMTLAAGGLHLKRSSQVRRVESERELPPVGEENLTVELWAQTAEVGWQTAFGMLVPGFPGEQRSAAVLEFAANTGLVHGPMAIRAVCRTPSGRTGGTNLFGEDLWMPGGWHHIVLTRGGGLARLFVDGLQVSEARVPTVPDRDRYFVVLGQLHAINWQEQPGLIRQFVGVLDECAVYDRLLSPEDIARHHALGRGFVKE